MHIQFIIIFMDNLMISKFNHSNNILVLMNNHDNLEMYSHTILEE